MRFFRVLLVFLIPLAVAGEGYRGVGALFDLGMGPLGPGMGGVALGLGLQPEGGYYEPASLGLEREVSLSLGYRRPFGVLGCLVAGMSGGGLGLYALNLDGGEISDGFRYQAYGVALAAGLGREGLALGLRWKGIFVPSGRGMAYGWTVDPGVAIRFRGLVLGAVAENLVSRPIAYGEHREGWPWRVSLDLWARLPWEPLSLFLGGYLGEGGIHGAGGGIIASLEGAALWAGIGDTGIHGGALFRSRGFSLGVMVGLGPDLPVTFGASLDYRLGQDR